MRFRTTLLRVFVTLAATVASGQLGQAQSQGDANVTAPAPNTETQATERPRRGMEGRGRPVFGKISGLQSDAIEITGQEGNKVTIKLTNSTEFRKERQPAKMSDFKVGDMVIVRTAEDSSKANGATALMVAAAPPRFTGRGGGQLFMQGTLGKDYIVGEVKSVDAPKLTILRVDNVTQTIELNEDTSLRRGRDSVTLADIQPGDPIFVRGAIANDAFVPKSVNVIPPEQWKRMQEMKNDGEGRGRAPITPPAATTPPAQQNPPEQRH